MPRFVTRTVGAIRAERPGLQRVTLDDGSRAFVLTQLVGPVSVGDEVVVNTTAVDLDLGTGGDHVVHWNLSRRAWEGPGGGHVMKLRYTSLQVDTGVAEEHGDAGPDSLAGRPVVACGLHSQVACVAAVVRDQHPAARVAYVMTDGASLPLALSDLVADLRRAHLIDITVTAGQAFGGDYEAVNVASALTVAAGAGADVIVVAMGPGAVGTGTTLGFAALEVAGVLDTAAWLGATPVVCVRWSDADPRARHRGLSHHTATALDAARASAIVPMPDGALGEHVRAALEPVTGDRHRVVTVRVPDVAAVLAAAGVTVTTMGRGPSDDGAFFVVAGAAGVAAASIAGEPGTVRL